MGYYYNDIYSSLLTFDNTNDTNFDTDESTNDLTFYPDGIIIINNETIELDFTDFIQTRVMNNILTERATALLTERNTNALLESSGFDVKDCLFKITINYKDGSSDVLTRSSMNDNNDTSWLCVKHKFNFTDEKYFNLDPNDVSNWPTIDITLHNLYGFKDNIKVPFSLKKSSYNQSNIRLKLISANIRNDNKVAYTFLDLNSNQIILTSSE